MGKNEGQNGEINNEKRAKMARAMSYVPQLATFS